MKGSKFWMMITALLLGSAVTMVNAKLPTPPMDDNAKAAAEANKAKAAEASKKAAEALAKSQDRVAERYRKEKGVNTAAMPAKKK